MRLRLQRKLFEDKDTIGDLFIDGVFFCNTLEDKYRNLEIEPKVQNETCIPYGTYKVAMTTWKKYGRTYPEILGVPHFEGIRIHAGNTDADTEGCILVGDYTGVDFISASRSHLSMLNVKIQKAMARGEDITIEVA